MSLLGKMLGSDKAIESTINAFKEGLDALAYTEEEKANDAAKERSEARQAVVEWMKATQGQNLTRRVLALAITFVWLIQYIGHMVLSIASIFFIEHEEQFIKAASILQDGANEMGSVVIIIIGFYFAAMHFDKIINPALDKLKGNK